MITIDTQSRQPIYEQIREQIVRSILLGELTKETLLPSVRSFAQTLGINPNTVQRSYNALEEEGVIYTVAGVGSYVSADPAVLEKLLQEQVGALNIALLEAKDMGITKEQVSSVVNNIYKEGKHNDNSNESH